MVSLKKFDIRNYQTHENVFISGADESARSTILSLVKEQWEESGVPVCKFDFKNGTVEEATDFFDKLLGIINKNEEWLEQEDEPIFAYSSRKNDFIVVVLTNLSDIPAEVVPVARCCVHHGEKAGVYFVGIAEEACDDTRWFHILRSCHLVLSEAEDGVQVKMYD